MSLADLVSVATECDFRPARDPKERERQWRRNWLKKPGVRAHLRRYKRAWRAAGGKT